MTIYELCTRLETDHGFTGDLQESSDACKDTAVRVFLTEVVSTFELAEYLPGEVAWPRYMITLLYTDPAAFARAYYDQWLSFVRCHKEEMSSAEMVELFFESEAISRGGYLLTCLQIGDYLRFATLVAEEFYLYAEARLTDLLGNAYADLHLGERRVAV